MNGGEPGLVTASWWHAAALAFGTGLGAALRAWHEARGKAKSAETTDGDVDEVLRAHGDRLAKVEAAVSAIERARSEEAERAENQRQEFVRMLEAQRTELVTQFGLLRLENQGMEQRLAVRLDSLSKRVDNVNEARA